MSPPESPRFVSAGSGTGQKIGEVHAWRGVGRGSSPLFGTSNFPAKSTQSAACLVGNLSGVTPSHPKRVEKGSSGSEMGQKLIKNVAPARSRYSMPKNRKDSTEFFRRMYGPVLARTRVRIPLSLIERGRKGGNARVRNQSPEERRKSSSIAGKARQANVSAEDRLRQLKIMEAGRRRLPQAVRTRAAKIAGKARWAATSEEERKLAGHRLRAYLVALPIEEKRRRMAVANAARLEPSRLRREAEAKAERERLKEERIARARAALAGKRAQP